MHLVVLPSLPKRAAEDAIAKLWYRLEQHGLRTPAIDVEFGSEGDTVRIVLRFADASLADLALQDIELSAHAEAVPISARRITAAPVLAFSANKPRR